MRQSLITVSLITGMSALNVSVPVQAQTAPTPSIPAERAITLIQNEAAIQLNTFSGNIEVLEFVSSYSEQQWAGYTANVQLIGTETQLLCSINVNELVRCQNPNQPILSEQEGIVDDRCGPERPEETLLEQVFTQNLFATLNDYAVRVYYSDDVLNNVRHLCMNVFDVRNQVLVGAIPIRASSAPGTVAYFSEQPLDGVDYQVILSPDERYLFRRSQGTSLLYEGFSR